MNRKLLTEHGQKTIAFSERPGVDFCLSAKEVGRGASCVVYHAVSSDQTEHLLKEYYPKHLDLSRDSSGQIIVPADQADAFEDGLQRFRAGCEQQKTIRLSITNPILRQLLVKEINLQEGTPDFSFNIISKFL